MTANDDKCLMCGLCCYKRHVGLTVKCSHLIHTDDGKTKCDVYGTHYGRYIGRIRNKQFMCTERVKLKEHIKGCPYNEDIKL